MAKEMDDEKEKLHAQLLALPGYGYEVVFDHLPTTMSQDFIRRMCEPHGIVRQVRIIQDEDTLERKGYHEYLRCSFPESKHTLLIANVPKTWTMDVLTKVLEDVGPGVVCIQLSKDPQNPSLNCGSACVFYHNNACAHYSLQKMSSASFKLDGITPYVTFANQSLAASASQNIPKNVIIDQLKELFRLNGGKTEVIMPPGEFGGNRDTEEYDFDASINEKEKHAELLALPRYGYEVVVDCLPSFMSEDHVRIIKDKDTGERKVYVAFTSKEASLKAIKFLYEDKSLRCSFPERKHILFIGNVPKTWTTDMLRKVLEDIGPGVGYIQLLKESRNSSMNCGFAFVYYHNNACAHYSMQKMSSASFKLDGFTPDVTFANRDIAFADGKNVAPISACTSQELFRFYGGIKKVAMQPGEVGGNRDTEEYDFEGTLPMQYEGFYSALSLHVCLLVLILLSC
ncbi:hypothetical protein RIF29_12138 [Crotalaria pallida]|uniref:RRM domain-containing protein n=1 Tax=Crotalaria pallida TaxID=3830 RepID=A0AAN9P0R0_CROPI